jgi:hypothetical protein
MAAQRQNPAYRPAKEKPRFGGAFLCVQSLGSRHAGPDESVTVTPGFSRSRMADASFKLALPVETTLTAPDCVDPPTVPDSEERLPVRR